MSGLKIAEAIVGRSSGLTFPESAVTGSFALLAVRGAGKSNAAVVMAEEMHAAGLPWVAIDPKGDWWGIRSSADGKGPGLSVPIFGGLHGDVPLEPTAGKMIAELIVGSNLTCVLDVSDFPSKASMLRFLTDFANHLFKLHQRSPQPRHLFLDEADEFIPQKAQKEQGGAALCVGAWSKVVKQGRNLGLGVTLITQRSAVVAKDVLTQTETLIALRTTAKLDRTAILGWVEHHNAGREIVDQLPTLDSGEAWVISPWFLKDVCRITFRRRSTFDSGATPTMGAARPVATMADIDLGAVRDQMAAVVAEAEANDPKVLRARVAQLERELAARPTVTMQVEVPTPFVPPEVLDVIAALGQAVTRGSELIDAALAKIPPLPGVTVVNNPGIPIRITPLDGAGVPNGPTLATTATTTLIPPAPSVRPLIETACELARDTQHSLRPEYYPPHMALMVGDRPEDEECARIASVQFMAAAAWRALA